MPLINIDSMDIDTIIEMHNLLFETTTKHKIRLNKRVCIKIAKTMMKITDIKNEINNNI